MKTRVQPTHFGYIQSFPGGRHFVRVRWVVLMDIYTQEFVCERMARDYAARWGGEVKREVTYWDRAYLPWGQR